MTSGISDGLTGAPVPSYATAHASCLRNSKVAVATRWYTVLERFPVAWTDPCEPGHACTPESRNSVPRFIYIPPNGKQFIVDWGHIVDFRRRDGTHLSWTEKSAGGPHYDLSVTDEAFYIYGNEGLWSGEASGAAKSGTGYTRGGTLLAFRFDAQRRTIVHQLAPSGTPRGLWSTWRVSLLADRFATPDRSYAELTYMGGRPGRGFAAISDEWTPVLAISEEGFTGTEWQLQNGTFHVFDPDRRGSDGEAIELARVPLSYVPRALSIVAPYVMIVSHGPHGSTVHCLDRQGQERWAVTVPFFIEQPPIDGTDGRVYVAGNGLAAIDEGAITWLQPSTVQVRATAFEDGTLAVTRGPELQLIDREGRLRRALRTTEDEPIPMPPAIAHDGSIWVATVKALYRAR